MGNIVPVITKMIIKLVLVILIFYAILNFVGFIYSYFQLMGIVYNIVLDASQNNYVDSSKYIKIFNDFENSNPFISDIGFGADTTLGEDSKVQYGDTVKITILAKFNWQLPLIRGIRGKDFDNNINYQGIFVENPNDVESIVQSLIDIHYELPALRFYKDI